jgi:hypothetical protein
MAKKTPAKSKLVVRPTVAYAEAKAEPPKSDEKEGKGEVEKPLETKPADPQAKVYEDGADEAPLAEAAPGAAEGASAIASAVPAAADDAPTARASEDAPTGLPPTIPAAPPAPEAQVGEFEALPPPDAIRKVDPNAPAPPPGPVPPGDSRSLRRRRGETDEFALVYRHESHLITRIGQVGRAGEWRDIEYPTVAAASRAYALETSRLVGEGFHDVH